MSKFVSHKNIGLIIKAANILLKSTQVRKEYKQQEKLTKSNTDPVNVTANKDQDTERIEVESGRDYHDVRMTNGFKRFCS